MTTESFIELRLGGGKLLAEAKAKAKTLRARVSPFDICDGILCVWVAESVCDGYVG